MKEQVMSKTLIGKMSNRWVEAGRGRGKKTLSLVKRGKWDIVTIRELEGETHPWGLP